MNFIIFFEGEMSLLLPFYAPLLLSLVLRPVVLRQMSTLSEPGHKVSRYTKSNIVFKRALLLPQHIQCFFGCMVNSKTPVGTLRIQRS